MHRRVLNTDDKMKIRMYRKRAESADKYTTTHIQWVIGDDWEGLHLYETIHSFSGKFLHSSSLS